MLNRRLPRITARGVLPHRFARGFLPARHTDKPVTRRNVLGSRLFTEICGHPRAETNIGGPLATTKSGSPPGPTRTLLAPFLELLELLDEDRSHVQNTSLPS
jgi:hypothetical protein